MVTIDSKPLFDFTAYSNTRLPINVLASFCFKEETFNIPGTDIGISVPPEHWVFTNLDKSDIFIFIRFYNKYYENIVCFIFSILSSVVPDNSV